MPQASHIVVVEADATLGTLLMELLTDEGYIVSLTSTLADGRSLLHATPPALLLIDIWLPSMTLADVVTEIQMADVGHIPTIALTCTPTDTVLLEVTRIDVVAKPFHLETLLTCVAKYARPSHCIQPL